MRVIDRDGRERVLATMEDVKMLFGFDPPAVSPDGKTVLIQRTTVSEDLMLIRNFR
jgi:hypothetical protein